MVADLFVLPGYSGDVLHGAAFTLQLLLVLQDHQGNVLPLQPATSTPQEGMQPFLHLTLFECVQTQAYPVYAYITEMYGRNFLKTWCYSVFEFNEIILVKNLIANLKIQLLTIHAFRHYTV